MASTPEPHESLADYLRRLRTASQMSQKELANRANIHLQSLGKIERGKTTRLNHKTLRGLAYALCGLFFQLRQENLQRVPF